MRAYVFAACTMLSSFGFFAAFTLRPALLGCDGCFSHHESSGLVVGFFFYIAMLVFALLAYFRMGIAWLQDKRLGFLWPVLGTIAALSTLCGAGLAVNGGVGPHLGLLRLSLIVTGPAVALSAWMFAFHSKRAKEGSVAQCSEDL